MYKLFSLIALLTAGTTMAQVDVQQYHFAVTLTDASDFIEGEAEIQFRLKAASPFAYFDLKNVGGEGKGMTVRAVTGPAVAGFRHSGDKLEVRFSGAQDTGRLLTIRVSYLGIPADGLIISTNQYGARTFFSDHWPDRARNWLPCNDHPSDKAAVAFTVTVPSGYEVVSNGLPGPTDRLKGGTTYRWKETIPIPTKVMAVGAANFAVQRVDSAYRVPVSAWVYPEDSAKGVFDYAMADDVLRFFDTYVGPFAFAKLANVQSKTIFGGMENAGAIFYAEKTVTGDRRSEDLVAHEVAHQWFGNMATEKSFAHLWLSEGFAVYLTNLYWEAAHGKEAFRARLREEREKVVQFARKWNRPVVDSVSPLMELLNANSYDKGGWVLHMLRGELGDSLFRQTLRTYYSTYGGRNADSRDFQGVAERVGRKDLGAFFQQWLYTPGHPVVQVAFSGQGKEETLAIRQTGRTLFRFPLTIAFTTADGKTDTRTFNIDKAEQFFPLDIKPVSWVLDPGVKLLFEEAK